MRCYPVHGRRTGSERNCDQRSRWLSLVVGLGGLEPPTSSLKENRPCINGLYRTKESRTWPGTPILIYRGGHRPWGSYQQNVGNRCANGRIRRSRSTIVAEVMCSHCVQLCALVLHRDPAHLGPPLPCYSTPRTRLTRRTTASRRRAVCRARSEGSSPRPVPRGRWSMDWSYRRRRR
jgi:hypothetical protein